jgi:hypothetical protein
VCQFSRIYIWSSTTSTISSDNGFSRIAIARTNDTAIRGAV